MHRGPRLSVPALFLAILIALPSQAQQSPCERRTIAVFFRDAQDLPIRDVSPADLEATLGGKPVKILSVTPDRRPHRVVIVLDSSGSMGSQTGERSHWMLALGVAQLFANENADNSQLALVIFGKQVTDTIGFTAGNAAVKTRLQQLATDKNYEKTNVKGLTALRDAIVRAVQLFDQPTSADAVYLLTDGGNNASAHNARDVTQLLAATSVRLFVILLPGLDTVIPEGDFQLEELSDLATNSGGEILARVDWQDGRAVFFPDSVNERHLRLGELLSRRSQAIFQEDLLDTELPRSISRDEHWKLKFSNAVGERWKGAHITYPTVLTGCPTTISP